jgi:hypothetical protein
MAKVTLSAVQDDVLKELIAASSRGKNIGSFLNRVTFQRYKQAQLNRWQTENASEPGGYPNSGPWKKLTDKYAKRKLTKCANMPGKGKAILIATGKLYQAASGQSGALNKVTSDYGIEVRIDSSEIPYAPYPGLTRPFMQFGEETERQMIDEVAAWLMTGVESP